MEIKQIGGDNMVSEEDVKKAVETLRGFSPAVLKAAILEDPDVVPAWFDNNNNNKKDDKK
jgi:hypothetical protein